MYSVYMIKKETTKKVVVFITIFGLIGFVTGILLDDAKQTRKRNSELHMTYYNDGKAKDDAKQTRKRNSELHMTYYNDGKAKGREEMRESAIEAQVGHFVIVDVTTGKTEFKWISNE